jgi:hypothetical protein
MKQPDDRSRRRLLKASDSAAREFQSGRGSSLTCFGLEI